MRLATYYLEDGREVDIHRYSKDGKVDHLAQDAYIDCHLWYFGMKFPSWEEVQAKWKEFDPTEGQ
jgi:hypothetical protein